MFPSQLTEQQMSTIERAVVAIVFSIKLINAHGAMFATDCKQVFAPVNPHAGGIPQQRILEQSSKNNKISFGWRRAPKHTLINGYHNGIL